MNFNITFNYFNVNNTTINTFNGTFSIDNNNNIIHFYDNLHNNILQPIHRYLDHFKTLNKFYLNNLNFQFLKTCIKIQDNYYIIDTSPSCINDFIMYNYYYDNRNLQIDKINIIINKII
jgi:hypothetical protein